MKETPLTHGYKALVDDEDYEWLSQWRWHTVFSGGGYGPYAGRTERVPGQNRHRRFAMHRMILNAPPGLQVDHANRNGLDNRRCNIRLCTGSQNQANKPGRRGTSRYKGVSWESAKRRWQVQIRINGKSVSLGRFTSEIEAAVVYNEAAQAHFGPFAFLNEIPSEAQALCLID